MHIAVCVKPIPDPAEAGSLNDDFTLKRPDKLVMDDADRYGVELALQMKDKNEGSTVTVFSMAPAGDGSALRTALAMGADRVVNISDDSLHGSDSLVTARVLAAAMKNESVDLVIAGTESTDGYSGVMPTQLAELLEFPSLTFATEVDYGEKLRVTRQTDKGKEVVESTLPALVTVTAGVVDPRYPTFKGIMAAKSKPFEQKTLADIDVDFEVGANGSHQHVVSAEQAPSRSAGEKIVDEGEAYLEVVAFLDGQKVT